YTIQFTAKTIHWSNLDAIGYLWILPKHYLKDENFNEVSFQFDVSSGPYQFKKDDYKKDISLTLKRNPKWWQKDRLVVQNMYNFDTLHFRYLQERKNAYEIFRKGDIDIMPIYTSHRWVNQTSGKRFKLNWILKQQVYNHAAVGFQGFAMNMRKFPFTDKHTRQAMCLLLNRDRMNKDLMFSQYYMFRSYWPDLNTKKKPSPNKLVHFDPVAARALLKKAGWVANPKTGLLEKNGKSFEFSFLTRSASSDKFIKIYIEDLAKVGIKLSINRKNWAAWMKTMDAFDYQMTWAAWGAGTKKDPEGLWHSKEADRKAGHNSTGFKNAAVDALIEKQKSIFDIKERHDIVRQIDQIIYTEFPYALLWGNNYHRILYWNKFGMPDWVFSKYGDEDSAISYWWFDEDAQSDLGNAQKNDKALPAVPFKVHYDKQFSRD
ncbi:MAG: ABC transporter substrate-binding protein, partial [Lentisphaeria bacterium]|nr:ABC transporter substrate-binding protein [Lentisphaeria bacterium]